MSESPSGNRDAQIGFNIFGLQLTLVLRRAWHWIVFFAAFVLIGFFTVLFFGSEKIRRDLADAIYPRPVQPQSPAVASSPPMEPVAPAGLPVSATPAPAPAAPPQLTNVDRKADPEFSDSNQEEKTSGGLPKTRDYLPPSAEPPRFPGPTEYRVRFTNSWTNQPFAYLPLRRAPGANEAKLLELKPGTAGLIATGRESERVEGSWWKTQRIRWIEVRFEGVTGWVSSPYVDQVLAPRSK